MFTNKLLARGLIAISGCISLTCWGASASTIVCDVATFSLYEKFELSKENRLLQHSNEQGVLFLSKSLAGFADTDHFGESPKITCQKIDGTENKSCYVTTERQSCDKPSGEFSIRQINDESFIVKERCDGDIKKYTLLDRTTVKSRDGYEWQSFQQYFQTIDYSTEDGTNYLQGSAFLVEEKLAFQMQHQVHKGTPIVMHPVLRLPKDFSDLDYFTISILGWYQQFYFGKSLLLSSDDKYMRYELTAECRVSN